MITCFGLEIRRLLKIIVISLITAYTIVAQYQNTPYHLQTIRNLGKSYVYEGEIFKKGTRNLITKNFQKSARKWEIRFSDRNWSFIDNILFNSDSCYIHNKYLVLDFDNDGLDEVIIPLVYKNRMDFYLYNHGDSLHNTVVFTINGTRFENERRISFTHLNLDEDTYKEFIILYNEMYPKPGSVRGAFAVDIETRSQIWYHPTAYYSLHTPGNYLPESSYLSWIIPTNAVCNGMAFSNGTFFMFNESTNNYEPYSTPYTGISSNTLDTSASDFSTDKRSAIYALCKSGNVVWEKVTGGEYVRTVCEITGKDSLLFAQWHRSKDDTALGRIGYMDIRTGNILKTYYSKKRIEKAYPQKRGYLFVVYNNNSFNIFDADLKPGLKKDTKDYILYDSFTRSGEVFYVGYSTLNNNFAQLILDKRQNLIATTPSSGYLYYLPKLDLFYIFNNNEAYLLELEYIPWYKRISANTLWIVVISIASLVIVILLLWGLTMHHASKRIKLQKQELENATSQLIHAEKLAVLGTISSSVAHELNSPLGAIINSAERLAEPQADKKEIDDNISLIRRAAGKSKVIIEKFLLHSRYDETYRESNFNEVYDDWISLFGKQYELLAISITTEFNIDRNLKIPPAELSQVINNLIANAKDSIVESDIEEKKIIIRTNYDNDSALIEVADNGKGFPEVYLENPFEAFNSSKEAGKGTGLGLWLVKKIVDLYGGRINLTNNKIGATVKVVIPVAEGENE